MTALWFTELTADDRVSVKPHASPVLHAINSLLGELSPQQLGTLRAFKGLQSYPSRSKDPDTVDYSTGSVGIDATDPSGERSPAGTSPTPPAHLVRPDGSSASSVTPNSTRVPSGKPFSTR